MIKRAKFYKTGHAFFGEGVSKEGFEGDVPTMPNAITIVVIKPNSTVDDIIESLEITKRDLILRKQQGQDIIK